MFKHDWRVYAVTANTSGGVKAHKLKVYNVTKAKANIVMRAYLAEKESARIVVLVKANRL